MPPIACYKDARRRGIQPQEPLTGNGFWQRHLELGDQTATSDFAEFRGEIFV